MTSATGHERGTEKIGQAMAELDRELRSLAAQCLRNERRGHTLQTTALVNEAFLRLAASPEWGNVDRKALLSAAAKAMRHVLVDHARWHRAAKRGGGRAPLPLDAETLLPMQDVDYLDLHDALDALERLDQRAANVVELRFFGGASVSETAAILGVGTRTVESDWAFARAWLRRALTEGGAVEHRE